MKNNYYSSVKDYYDIDSTNFENRYWENQTLQRIRSSFRKESVGLIQESVLEIGFGPGLDVNYFAEVLPKSSVYGIDISEGMYHWATEQAAKKALSNVQLAIGSVEDISSRFEGVQFDHVYVYFGALNTVEDISFVQEYLKKCLKPNGTMVLTFVNKWYMMAVLKPLLKLKFKESKRRLNKVWGGYSPNKFLASKCYASADIKKHFNLFTIEKKRGYSILYPAWYENHITNKYPRLTNFLWKCDKMLQKTPFWNFGEYTLYVMRNNP